MKKLIALLLAVLMLVSLCACGNDTDSGETTGTPTNGATNPPATDGTTPAETNPGETETTPTQSGLELSDDFADCMVMIEGIVYQLPCNAQVFIDNGWIPEAEWVLDDDYEVSGGESIGCDMFKDDGSKEIGLKVYNPGKDGRSFGECIVYKVYNEVDTDVEFVLSGGFELTAAVTAQNVFDIFGEDYSYNQFNGDWYNYSFPGKVTYTFTIKEDSLAYFSIELASAMYEN